MPLCAHAAPALLFVRLPAVARLRRLTCRPTGWSVATSSRSIRAEFGRAPWPAGPSARRVQGVGLPPGSGFALGPAASRRDSPPAAATLRSASRTGGGTRQGGSRQSTVDSREFRRRIGTGAQAMKKMLAGADGISRTGGGTRQGGSRQSTVDSREFRRRIGTGAQAMKKMLAGADGISRGGGGTRQGGSRQSTVDSRDFAGGSEPELKP